MKTTTLYISGMHCSACELLVERKLLTLTNIHGTDASLKDGRVTIQTEGALRYSIDELNEVLSELGYTCSRQQPKKNQVEKVPILYVIEGERGIRFDGKAFLRRYEWITALIIFLLAWRLISALELGRFMNPEGPETVVGLVLLGFVASLSSCAALIGGLLMSLTKQWHERTLLESRGKKVLPHIQFHAGRVLGFMGFGALLGLLGERITLDNISVYAVLVLVVSIIMAILALQMLGVRAANKLRIRMPSGIAKNVLEHPKRGPFLIGAGTFFLPCGFTLIAQALALASGSAWQGALLMGLFALGTLPVLVGISALGLKMNAKPARTARFNKYAGILILFFALYNVNGQLNVLGLPSASDLSFRGSQDVELAEPQLNKDGEQIVSIIAKGFRYTATSNMTIEAGQPTKLVVDDQGMQGCGVYLAVAGLLDGFVALNAGENVIDLGVPKKGTYKITCSMGMVPPVILRVK